MTPKEKADNLCTRYIYRTTEYVSIDDAKKCALITVDEILGYIHRINKAKGIGDKYIQLSTHHWEEVKQHIEQL